MLRFLLMMFLCSYGFYAQADVEELEIMVNVDPVDGDRTCASRNSALSVSIAGVSQVSSLVIKCGAGADKTERFRKENFRSGQDVVVAYHDGSRDRDEDKGRGGGRRVGQLAMIKAGERCDVTVTANREEVTESFGVGWSRGRDRDPSNTKEGAVTAGQHFSLGNWVPGQSFRFDMWTMRECHIRTEDPWLFIYRQGGSHIERIDPQVFRNPYAQLVAVDKNPSNNARCEGKFDGVIENIFTIGDAHTNCKLKLFEETNLVNQFNEAGIPNLASAAAVSMGSTADKPIMVHTGAKPSSPSGIPNNIEVYISTNGGASWDMTGAITSWTSAAVNSGIEARGNDNTRNMALIKITGDNVVWWRIIKGT